LTFGFSGNLALYYLCWIAVIIPYLSQINFFFFFFNWLSTEFNWRKRVRLSSQLTIDWPLVSQQVYRLSTDYQRVQLTVDRVSQLKRLHWWLTVDRVQLTEASQQYCRVKWLSTDQQRVSESTDCRRTISESTIELNWLSIESTDYSESASQLRLNISEFDWLSTEFNWRKRVNCRVNWLSSIDWPPASQQVYCRLAIDESTATDYLQVNWLATNYHRVN